jgi:hypothetical protein
VNSDYRPFEVIIMVRQEEPSQHDRDDLYIGVVRPPHGSYNINPLLLTVVPDNADLESPEIVIILKLHGQVYVLS